MIILVGGEKGGPGKTTLAINLASMRTKVTDDLLLIDTDKQPTSSYWCSIREDKQILPRVASIQKFGKSVRTETLALKEKYEDIIIDAGGRDSPELRGGLLVAKKAVFPLRPSQFDLWTLGRLNTLVETASEFNEGLKAFILIISSLLLGRMLFFTSCKNMVTEFEQENVWVYVEVGLDRKNVTNFLYGQVLKKDIDNFKTNSESEKLFFIKLFACFKSVMICLLKTITLVDILFLILTVGMLGLGQVLH